jgi:predicted transcriptional regulator
LTAQEVSVLRFHDGISKKPRVTGAASRDRFDISRILETWKCALESGVELLYWNFEPLACRRPALLADGYVGYYSYIDSYNRRPIMKTVQMTLDEQLVKAVDSAAKKLGKTRSGFTREALRSALREVRARELESKHRQGYKRKPVKRGEFSDWESEQVWGD